MRCLALDLSKFTTLLSRDRAEVTSNHYKEVIKYGLSIYAEVKVNSQNAYTITSNQTKKLAKLTKAERCFGTQQLIIMIRFLYEVGDENQKNSLYTSLYMTLY